ncbi:copper-binding protein [Thiofaba sp. EF100]|uniref:copper-binding protein n=1 Tax=Thiofaba sp. EF100 TaxID=3121274 RepID=UPI003221A063
MQGKIILMTAILPLALGIHAQAATPSHADHDHATPEGMAQHMEMVQNEALAEGEVRKVDKSAGKITLKHGPLPNLGMGAMTMVFRPQDPALLDQLKAGDRIRFRAESINGVLTITKVEKAP